uniref:Aminotransferase class I/classII domain-containing protein n=1 Tax=Acrobeloides nanus TaxID=290746 RepID=A0A914CQ31_9BILA
MLVRSLPNNQLNNKFLSINGVSNEKVDLTDDDIETKAKLEIDNNPKEWAILEGSTGCRQAINRIRKVFEAIGKIPFNKEKVPIRMDMGDPTVALSECGKTILLPDPGFPLYGALCKKYNVETRTYPINMEEGVIDLKRLEEQIDKNTIAMIVNNPMNPAGIVFSKSHLEEVLKIAYKHKIIIIADEIYGDLTFNNANFYPLATLSPKVTIICCDGISKRYLVPGWRLGWLILYNRYNVLDEMKMIILSYTQHLMGACAILQGALPAVLEKTPITFKESTCKLLQNNADIICNKLSD